MFPLTRPTLFQTSDSAIFLSVKMQNKKVNHRPSTKYLYFHKITGPTLFFSGEKIVKKKKKKSFSYLPTIFFFSLLEETQLFFYALPGATEQADLITKTYLYNFDPLKPNFYVVKLGLTGVCIIFLISAQKHRLWVLDEAVLTSTHNLCFEQKYEKYQNFLSEDCHVLVVEFSVYLNRRVFVMCRR